MTVAVEFDDGNPPVTVAPAPQEIVEPQPVPSAKQQTMIARLTRDAELSTMTPFEFDAEVWRLTTLGWASWRVCAELRIQHPREVSEAIDRYLKNNELTDTQKRQIMVGQLDEAIERTMEVLGHTHFKVYKGTLIMVPSDPCNPDTFADDTTYVPLVDDGPTLDAAKTLAVLLDRKAKLLGLDAPERHEHTILPLPPAAQNWVASKRVQIIEGTAS
jgi:hypothetical protein